MTFDQTNEKFALATDLVHQSSRNLFLTGKAGTGKTTFLKYIRENCPKQMAVVAPTGVAAINAGGVTIHSFFQLPLSPFVPVERGFSKSGDDIVGRNSLISRLRFTAEKRKVIQQLELLVIDEISMVRCDLLDAIDTVLRHVRRNPHEKFGGVQVLFIGDMYQLPPVIKDQEWNMLSGFYNSPYFFDSVVLKKEPPLYIEFDKIYRQSEEQFIRLLNQVRNNDMDEAGFQLLERQHQPFFKRNRDDGYIILTTHNEMARLTNIAELGKLDAPLFSYNAVIEGDFPETVYPAEEVLQLKIGAQVMFIKNDTDKAKRYFNGKIGVITELKEDKITVQCKDEPSAIEVKPEKWENIRYTLNKTTRQLEEQMLGSFTQFPLRLAWAITIHKSQGLTFEKAIIDAGDAFAPGQVYVALSRCTNLNGMILKSRIKSNSLSVDPRIVRFSQNHSQQKLAEAMLPARKEYQQKLLLSSFDLSAAIHSHAELHKYLIENSKSFNPESLVWADKLSDKLDTLQQTAQRFHSWMQAQFHEPSLPEENKVLQERLSKAAAHFITELTAIIGVLKQSPAVTDSRAHAKEFNETAKELFAELSQKLFLLECFKEKFGVATWQQRKKNFVLPGFSINAYAGSAPQKIESPHPELHQQLRKLRDNICAKKDLPIYMVAGTNTLYELAAYLPQTLSELRKISGFGEAKTEQYGKQFLDIIVDYCGQHDLSSLVHEKKPKRERKERTGPAPKKGDTHAESFRLFREGKTIADIAKERRLTMSTIEGHLAKFVLRGDIKIEELVSQEKIMLIEPLLSSFDGGSVNPIKQQLGDAVSFGEIRLVIASLRRNKDF